MVWSEKSTHIAPRPLAATLSAPGAVRMLSDRQEGSSRGGGYEDDAGVELCCRRPNQNGDSGETVWLVYQPSHWTLAHFFL